MVNDIMSLSHLDEGLTEEKFEETDIFDRYGSCGETKASMAAKKDIESYGRRDEHHFGNSAIGL